MLFQIFYLFITRSYNFIARKEKYGEYECNSNFDQYRISAFKEFPTSHKDNNMQSTTETETTREATPSNLDNNDPLNDMLKIYEESMEDNISLYCEDYLTFEGSPFKNLESIRDIITDEHQFTHKLLYCQMKFPVLVLLRVFESKIKSVPRRDTNVIFAY